MKVLNDISSATGQQFKRQGKVGRYDHSFDRCDTFVAILWALERQAEKQRPQPPHRVSVDVSQLQIPLEALKLYVVSSVSTLSSDNQIEKSEHNGAVSIG